ncbi:MAG: hypothetical protein ACIAS6_04260 [Phycisphaerales bacterium JB060]
MARRRIYILGITGIAMAIQGCSTGTYTRAERPTFAASAPRATAESWASVMPMPGGSSDALAYARRDTALGLPPPGSTPVAGAWRDQNRPSLERYWIVPLQRSPRSFLFFTAPAQHERRAPRVPSRAHPWRTAW